MTQGMALTRALASNEALEKITHVGSNSGGNWLSSQLVYSESFFSSLRNPLYPLDDFVKKWGELYGSGMTSAVESGALWATEFSAGTFSVLHPLCTVTGVALEKLISVLESRDFPAWVWLPYVSTMLQPWINDINNATYGTRAMTGLKTATLLQQVSLPPDAFLDESIIATRSVSYKASYSPNTASTSYVLPLSHVQPPTSTGLASSWLMSSEITGITAKSNEIGSKPVSLLQDRDPLIAEIASASSSAAGLLASPTMVEEWVPGTRGNPLDSCWPLGLEMLASPMLVDGYSLPTGEAAAEATVDPGNLLYRYLDGGYTDNSNAAMTLAQMQAECASKSEDLDCSNGIKMIIADDNGQPSLWFDPIYPPGSFLPPARGGFNGPVPTMFAETFPAVDAWIPYASLGNDSTRSTAYYWTGSVTSVQNDWYGVKGGQTVELLYFTGFDNPIIVAGADAADLFGRLYAPSAVAQAAGAAPIIAAFLSK